MTNEIVSTQKEITEKSIMENQLFMVESNKLLKQKLENGNSDKLDIYKQM